MQASFHDGAGTISDSEADPFDAMLSQLAASPGCPGNSLALGLDPLPLDMELLGFPHQALLGQGHVAAAVAGSNAMAPEAQPAAPLAAAAPAAAEQAAAQEGQQAQPGRQRSDCEAAARQAKAKVRAPAAREEAKPAQGHEPDGKGPAGPNPACARAKSEEEPLHHSGGSGGSGSGKGEKLTLRERNRIAQRRFRERSRVKQQDFEERVASLADELARAKLEKSEAEGKNAMLEKMVELHKEGVLVACTGEKVENPAQLQGQLSWKPGRTFEFYGKTEEELQEGVTLTVHEGRTSHVTLEQVKGFSLQQAIDIWREYLLRMEELLQGPETDAQNQRLVDLLEEVSAVLSMLDLTAPATAHRMKTCRLDDVDSGAVPDTDHWRMAIDAMGMTEAQKPAMLELRRIYLTRLGAVLWRRHQISLQLQASRMQST
eukprot:jgi/Astpho2/4221/Aster-x1206